MQIKHFFIIIFFKKCFSCSSCDRYTIVFSVDYRHACQITGFSKSTLCDSHQKGPNISSTVKSRKVFHHTHRWSNCLVQNLPCKIVEENWKRNKQKLLLIPAAHMTVTPPATLMAVTPPATYMAVTSLATYMAVTPPATHTAVSWVTRPKTYMTVTPSATLMVVTPPATCMAVTSWQ